jgi:uncharacterized membrane protein YGL010W
MRTVDDWLEEYGRSHRNPLNRKLHFACIPPIVFSVFCALKAIPIGDVWLNAASVMAVAVLAYYWRLSWRLALGICVVFGVLYAGAVALSVASGSNLVGIAAGFFAVGWIGQFVGHHIEGARPSFFKDLQFLLIGPLWELAHVYRALGLPIDAGFVNAVPEFLDHSQVVNGASDLFLELFGEKSRHTRMAIGVSGLPYGVAVEVEAVFEVK